MAVALFPVQTFADSQTGCGPIISGLWSGVNTALGTNYDCQGNVTNTPNAERNSAPVVSQLPPNALPSTPPNAHTGEYVALGDSVAAGLGLPLISTANNPVCGASDAAYSATVAASLGVPYRNIACSGATVGDLVTDQNVNDSESEIGPQLDAAFVRGTPSLITITAGANDVYWGAFLRECYVSTCGGSTDQVLSSGLRAVLRVKLAYALTSIYSRSDGNPPSVILTGYYQPLSAACAQAVPNFTASEISWLDSQTTALNQAIADVASNYSFVRFAPVDFSGHELCTSDPWVQGISDLAPFHPTARGQQAIAQSVLARVP